MHYDEKYDMDVLHDWWYSGGVQGNVIIAKGMREPGVEPGYLAVPDPKSRLHTASEPPSPPAQDQGTAQSRPSPVGADETTTNSTTDFGDIWCPRCGSQDIEPMTPGVTARCVNCGWAGFLVEP